MDAVAYFLEGARRGTAKRTVGEQNRAFLEFCAREGFEVAATFIDTEHQSDPEAGFRQLVEYISRADRGFTVVCVDSPGALGPDLGQAALRLLRVEAHGVKVLSVQTGKEVARDVVDQWADRAEGTPVSERVRSAMRKKAVRGEVLGRPPYGYQVGPRRRLELVPEEAVVVRYIFRLYLQEGLGIRRIAGQLNEENIPTRRGGRWSMVTVRDILRNRTYLGTYTRFGVKVPGSHAPLVNPDDFRRVQDRLQAHAPAERTRTVEPFLLSGLVHCARCGNRLIGVSRRQKWKTKAGEERTGAYRYYQCETRTNQSSCDYNTQRAQELESRVRAVLSGEEAGVMRSPRAGNADSYTLDAMGQVSKIESRLRRTRREVEELVADTAHGHLSLERMRSLGVRLVAQHEGVAEELAAARARVAAGQSEADRRRHLEETRARVGKDWERMALPELQLALREVIERIEVADAEMRLYLR